EGIQGILHGCSPHPVSNKEFMRALRQARGRSFGLPLPRPLAKVGALIKVVDPSLLLDSVPVTSFLTIEKGFKFNFPYIQTSFNLFLRIFNNPFFNYSIQQLKSNMKDK